MPNLYLENESDAAEKFNHPKFNIIRVGRFDKFRPYPNSHYRGTIYGYINHPTDHFVPMPSFRAEKLSPLGDFLLNNPILMSFAQIKTISSGRFFFKSNVGTKHICGGVYSVDQFISYYSNKVFDEELILVAAEQKIEREFRCFVSGRLITSSVYVENDEVLERPVDKYENRILEEICEKALTKYRPAPIFVCDIAKTFSGEYKVIEYNAWNCSGLYCCDANLILEELLCLTN